MTADEAEKIISLGENLNVEFKVGLSSNNPKAICKEIAALAATTGGYLFIGVSDDGEILGIDEPIVIRDKIERWCASTIVPPPIINPFIIALNDGEILVVEVANGTAPLYSYDDRYFVRVGTSSSPLNAASIVDVVRGRKIEDVIASMESTIAVANTNAIAAMYTTAPGIQGQGDLATMNYSQLRDRLFSEIRLSSAFAALETGIAVAQSTASMALASPPSIIGNRDSSHQAEYSDLLNRLSADIESSPVIRMIQTSASIAQSSSSFAQSLVAQMQTGLAEVKALAGAIQSDVASISNSNKSNTARIAYLESRIVGNETEIQGVINRLSILKNI